MPVYEYECTCCDHHFDLKQGFHDEPVTVCPQCGGKSRRVIHSVPIMFKGSGFYVNDYGRNASWHRDKEEADGKKDDGKAIAKKEEAKAVAKDEGKTVAKDEKKAEAKKEETKAEAAT